MPYFFLSVICIQCSTARAFAMPRFMTIIVVCLLLGLASNMCRHRAIGPLRPLTRTCQAATLNFPAGRRNAPNTRRGAGGKTIRLSSALFKPFRGISSLASLAPVFHNGLTMLPRDMKFRA